MNCLVADDIQVILIDAVMVVLNVFGEDTRIFEAKYSEKVLKIVKDNHIDISILDVEMPTENGIETAKRIKVMKPDIKIILTSGDYTYASEAITAGTIDFISKPMSEDNLRECLQTILKEHLQHKFSKGKTE